MTELSPRLSTPEANGQPEVTEGEALASRAIADIYNQIADEKSHDNQSNPEEDK